MIALTVGTIIIPSVYVIFYLDDTLTSLDKIVYPVLFGLVLLSLVSFVTVGKRFLVAHEYFWFSIVYLFILAQFAFLLNEYRSGAVQELSDFVIWLSVLYLLAYVIFPARTALIWTATFLFAIFVIGLYYGIVDWGTTGFSKELSVLLQIYASSIIYIILLNAFALLKGQYIETEMRAELMETIANTDVLTDLLSRAKLTALLDQHFDPDRPNNNEVNSIILLDVDRLKYVNDTFGHLAGDYVLQTIAELLRSNLRQSDLLGRWGGDEFLLICPGLDQEGALMLSERLERAVEEAEFRDIGHATISTGPATYTPGDTPLTLLQRADKAMYARKTINKQSRPVRGDASPFTEASPRATSSIQPASPEMHAVAAELIYQTFPETADYILGLGRADKAKTLLGKLFPQKGNRFSYEFTDLLCVDGKPYGLLLSYPGSQIDTLEGTMFWQMLRASSTIDFLRFLSRAFPLRKIKEAEADEFFINNIAVLPDYRSLGYGTTLLNFAEDRARRNGLKIVSLSVEHDNHRAIHFYERAGYEVIQTTVSMLKQPKDGKLVIQKMAKILS
jgi:diguanylate cyclase (GGDEF)-like protein